MNLGRIFYVENFRYFADIWGHVRSDNDIYIYASAQLIISKIDEIYIIYASTQFSAPSAPLYGNPVTNIYIYMLVPLFRFQHNFKIYIYANI